jgi:hypothetical protein
MRLRAAFEWLLAAFVGLVALFLGIQGLSRSRWRLGTGQHFRRTGEPEDEDDDRAFAGAPFLSESSGERLLYLLPAERPREPREAPGMLEHTRAIRYEARVRLLVTDVDAVAERSLRGQDVTGEVIDVEARLRAARTAEQRYLSLVERAERVQDVLRVEEELRRIRAEIERLESQQRFLQERVSFAVVTVALRSARSLGQRMQSAFRAGWDRGIGVMVDLANLGGRLAALGSVIVPAGVVLVAFLRWFASRLVMERQGVSSDRISEQPRD